MNTRAETTGIGRSLTKKRRDATGSPIDAAKTYVCIESYGGSGDALGGFDGCARGTRLQGDHEKVVTRPHFFAPATLHASKLHALRIELAGGPEYAHLLSR